MTEEAGAKAASAGRRARLLGALIGLLAVASAGGLAYGLRGQLPPAWIAATSVLAAIGLFSCLAWIAGLLRFAGAETSPFLDVVADGFRDPAVLTDRRGLAVYANAPYLTLASKAEARRLVGMDMLYAGHPEFSEPIYQLAQAAKEGKALHRDVRVGANSSVPGSAAGDVRWLRLSVAPAHDNHVLWRLTDITADRAHQENAFTRLQFIITYLDHAPAGFFSTLPDGRVDYVNATLADWMGIDLPAAQDGRLPLASLVGEDTARSLVAVEPVKGGSRIDHFVARLPLKDGGALPATIIHRADFDAEGKPMPFRSMVLRDDHGVKAGSASGTNVRGFGAVAPVGLAQFSEGGTVSYANAAFLLLSNKIKLHGRMADAIVEKDRTRFHEALQAAVKGERRTIELAIGEGEPRAVELTLAHVDGEGGVLAFAVDRTENKALEVQLAQSQKMQAVGQLASGIAHDFNNVLTPIIGFADLLLAKMRPTDAAFADIMNIKQNANRAANLVRQLLAFSRKQTMQPKMHLLTEAMSDLGNLLGRVLGEKIELEIVHGRDPGFVMADIHQFEQVVINLAVNARDAMPKGGKLTVKTYNISKEQSREVGHALPEAEYVVCEVADTGTGIPKDILDKIWEPFFSTKDVGKGTGLGLSMVYGIVKQTGGFIFCDSEVGKGTTFRIFLPRKYPEAAAAETATAAKPEPQRADFTGRGRILVVEDEDSVRAFAVRALTSRGYTVVEADSGESALSVIEDDKDGFELILSDVVMPEMDGPTMLAEIRRRGIATKLVFMSGYSADAFDNNPEYSQDQPFLQKPFTLKELLEKVKEVMG
ncbi:MAG: response regulator [Proteobacteria bacterium]|nr:response regulator [Pseudomonadota bacterium]